MALGSGNGGWPAARHGIEIAWRNWQKKKKMSGAWRNNGVSKMAQSAKPWHAGGGAAEIIISAEKIGVSAAMRKYRNPSKKGENIGVAGEIAWRI